MEIRHHNYTLDGSDIPYAVGDRYYAQDLERDFYNQKEYSARLSEDYLGLYERYSGNIVINGCTVTQGAGHTVSWTAGRVKVTHTQKTPTDWSALPPSMTSHTIPHIVDVPAASDQAITGATTDGVTVNYVKIALNESGTSSRTRAKKAGTYNSEVSEGYTFTCNSTVPAANEVAIATFTSNGAALTFTYDEPRWRKKKDTTTTYTTKVYDSYVTGSGTYTINLIAIASSVGQDVWIDNIGTGTLTIDPNGAETIEGMTTISVYPQEKVYLYNNGTRWEIKNEWRPIYSTTTTYTIQDIDIYKRYEATHSTTTGLVTFNLPTLSANIGKEFLFINGGTYAGLTKIVSEEGSNIIFDETHDSLSEAFICDLNDKISFLATSNGWLITKYECNIDIGGQNRSDWTNTEIGNRVAYDNGSGTSTKASDWTGLKINEGGGSSVTFIVIEDTGGSGTSGIFYFYKITDVGYLTNNRVLTASNGETIDVNEGGGTSKDVDGMLFYNLGLLITNINYYYNTSSAIASASRIPEHEDGSSYGFEIQNLDSNSFRGDTSPSGFKVNIGGVVTTIAAQDSYVIIILKLRR